MRRAGESAQAARGIILAHTPPWSPSSPPITHPRQREAPPRRPAALAIPQPALASPPRRGDAFPVPTAAESSALYEGCGYGSPVCSERSFRRRSTGSAFSSSSQDERDPPVRRPVLARSDLPSEQKLAGRNAAAQRSVSVHTGPPGPREGAPASAPRPANPMAWNLAHSGRIAFGPPPM